MAMLHIYLATVVCILNVLNTAGTDSELQRKTVEKRFLIFPDFFSSAHWGEWSSWAQCIPALGCGAGIRTRTRTCLDHTYALDYCKGDSVMSKVCHINCSVDGQWGQWYDIGGCSVSCGVGHVMQYRGCNNPEPSHGGKHCVGETDRTVTCYPSRCPTTSSATTATPIPTETTTIPTTTTTIQTTTATTATTKETAFPTTTTTTPTTISTTTTTVPTTATPIPITTKVPKKTTTDPNYVWLTVGA